MGCAYTGSAGGPTRTEIPMPIPICADDVVERDNTETDNIKTPNTNQPPERFIFTPLLVAQTFWPKNRNPISNLGFASYKPRMS
jgi:hypothetical protein